MIPSYPTFKKIEIEDKTEIESHTKNFPPYSDYNFTSLWTWNIDDKTEISKLYDNLVFKFQDYITNEVFYSFLGKNNVDETARELVSLAKNMGILTNLRLEPESVVQNFKDPQHFIIKEDRDNFDYVLSVQNLIDLQGKEYRGKKNFVNRFKNLFADKSKIIFLDLNKVNVKEEILQLFNRWEISRNKNRNETNNELKAIQKVFKYFKQLSVRVVGLYIDNQLAAFSINEFANEEYGVIHYEKADTSFPGVFQYLKQQSAIDFDKNGYKYINYEQDLGIDGLRRAKLNYHPVKFLKKYTISLRENH